MSSFPMSSDEEEGSGEISACYIVFKLILRDLSKFSTNFHYPPKSDAELAWDTIHMMSDSPEIPTEVDVSTVDQRQPVEITVQTFTKPSSHTRPLPAAKSRSRPASGDTAACEEPPIRRRPARHMLSYSESEMAHSDDWPAALQEKSFFSGNPEVETTKGSMRLYKTNDSVPIDDIHTRMLAILGVPSTFAIDQLLRFINEFTTQVQKLQILFQTDSPLYLVFILFYSEETCKQFYMNYNGRQFSSLEQEVCHCAFVRDVTIQKVDSGPPPELTELPHCIICLERMDESVEGLLTAPCNHEFHLQCLRKYKGTDCPVCRYCLMPPEAKTASTCLVCGSAEDLWLCLLCGHVGCGRYTSQHAVDHFSVTSHTFAMELRSERVWDYVRDQYVHRLIQTKGEGKPVEYTNVGEDAEVDCTDEEKLDSIQVEYTYLISSELQKQRAYYEEKMRVLETESAERMRSVESRLKDMSEERTRLEAQLQTLRKEKASLEKRLADCKSRLDSTEKDKKGKLAELESLNESLIANQVEYKKIVQRLKQENQDLQEYNRDLMFTISAQQKISNLNPQDQSDIASGSVQVGASSPTGGGGARPKRGRGNKKG